MGAVVNISVDSNGNVACDPTQLTITTSDAVEFSSARPDFVVAFKGRSPFHKAVIEGKNGSSGPTNVRNNAVAGNYFCAVSVDKDGELYLGNGPTITVTVEGTAP